MLWRRFRDVLALLYYMFTVFKTHVEKILFEFAQNASFFKISTSARIASTRAVQKSYFQVKKTSN